MPLSGGDHRDHWVGVDYSYPVQVNIWLVHLRVWVLEIKLILYINVNICRISIRVAAPNIEAALTF